MNTANTRWQAHLRVVWAITAKDILEALKNKNTISVIVVSLLMVVFYRIYPGLSRGNEPLNVLVYDAGASTLPARLEGSRAIRAWVGYRSEAHMQEMLAEGDIPELGLVIPAGFDQAAAAGGEVTLPGYAMYWVKDADVAAARSSLEAELSRLIGRPVAIELQPRVNHRPASAGIGVQAAMSVIFILVMIGLMLVAHLMLEEKKNRTLEVMLVSPASAGHLVAAKALTGLFYTLLGAGVALAINRDLIVHWPLAIAALAAGALFVVALGLWMGLRIEDRGQLTLWSWILIIPLLIPVFLVLLTPLIPAAVVRAMAVIPTVVLFNLLRMAIADPISIVSALLGLAGVLAWTGAALALVIWQVGRQDRVGEAKSVPQAGGLRVSGGASQSTGLRYRPASTAGRLSVLGVALPPPLRIILTIAAKDIREAARNRLFIAILLGVGLMVGTNVLLQVLLYRDTIPTAVVYDEGNTPALRELARRRDFRLTLVDSRLEMERAVTEARGSRLGLVIPADLGAHAAGSQPVALDGYMAHWAKRDTLSQWATFFSEQITAASGTVVRVSLDTGAEQAGRVLYPAADAGGQPLMTVVLLAIVIATLGLALVPLLLVEEKEAHTLDTLLVSPASLGQLVAAKTVAGFTYCLAAAAMLIAFNWPLIVSFPAALVAILLGTACAVALGLLVGTLSDNPTTLSVWGAGGLLGLIGVTAAAFLAPVTWPAAVRAFLTWLPGAQTIHLLRYAMAESVPGGQFWASVAALAGAAAALYIMVGLLLHRVNR